MKGTLTKLSGPSGLRVLLALVLILGVLAIQASGGTLAYFTSTATSTDNTFLAGTLTLEIADGNEAYSDSIIASIGGSNLAPGDVFYAGYVDVTNTGSLDLRYAVTFADITADDEGPNIALSEELEDATVVVEAQDEFDDETPCNAVAGEADQTALAKNGNLNNLVLGQLVQSGDGWTDQELVLEPNDEQRLCFYVTYPLGVENNDPQGGTATYELTFAAEQTANNPVE